MGSPSIRWDRRRSGWLSPAHIRLMAALVLSLTPTLVAVPAHAQAPPSCAVGQRLAAAGLPAEARAALVAVLSAPATTPAEAECAVKELASLEQAARAAAAGACLVADRVRQAGLLDRATDAYGLVLADAKFAATATACAREGLELVADARCRIADGERRNGLTAEARKGYAAVLASAPAGDRARACARAGLRSLESTTDRVERVVAGALNALNPGPDVTRTDPAVLVAELLALAVVLLLLRRLISRFRTRRIGPIEIAPVAHDEAHAQEASDVERTMRETLASARIFGPAQFRVGPAFEAVVSTAEAVPGGGSTLAKAARAVASVVVADVGYTVRASVCERTASPSRGVALELSNRRSATTVLVKTYWEGSYDEAARRCALVVYQYAAATTKWVSRKTPSWARWTAEGAESLMHYTRATRLEGDEAAAELARAIALEPGNATLRITFGRHLGADRIAALGAYLRAAQLAPNYPEALYRVGLAYGELASEPGVSAWKALAPGDQAELRRLITRSEVVASPPDLSGDAASVKTELVRLAVAQWRLTRRSLRRNSSYLHPISPGGSGLRPLWLTRKYWADRDLTVALLTAREIQLSVLDNDPPAEARLRRRLGRIGRRRWLWAPASRAGVHYNLACAYAQTSPPDVEAALGHLALTLTATTRPSAAISAQVRRDPDLTPVRDTTEFRTWAERFVPPASKPGQASVREHARQAWDDLAAAAGARSEEWRHRTEAVNGPGVVTSTVVWWCEDEEDVWALLGRWTAKPASSMPTGLLHRMGTTDGGSPPGRPMGAYEAGAVRGDHGEAAWLLLHRCTTTGRNLWRDHHAQALDALVTDDDLAAAKVTGWAMHAHRTWAALRAWAREAGSPAAGTAFQVLVPPADPDA